MSNRRAPKHPLVKPARQIVMPKYEPGKVVIVERIEEGVDPEYCVHGRVQCVRCDAWCWLGNQTVDVAMTHAPLCQPCAVEIIPQGRRPVAHVQDHRRTDGPH